MVQVETTDHAHLGSHKVTRTEFNTSAMVLISTNNGKRFQDVTCEISERCVFLEERLVWG